MNPRPPESMVSIYSTPVEFDAEIVKAMLLDEDIPSSIENANSPFPGVPAVACQVLVSAEHEVTARRLVEEHAERLRDRDGRDTDEYIYETDADPEQI